MSWLAQTSRCGSSDHAARSDDDSGRITPHDDNKGNASLRGSTIDAKQSGEEPPAGHSAHPTFHSGHTFPAWQHKRCAASCRCASARSHRDASGKAKESRPLACTCKPPCLYRIRMLCARNRQFRPTARPCALRFFRPRDLRPQSRHRLRQRLPVRRVSAKVHYKEESNADRYSQMVQFAKRLRLHSA